MNADQPETASQPNRQQSLSIADQRHTTDSALPVERSAYGTALGVNSASSMPRRQERRLAIHDKKSDFSPQS